MNATPGFRLGQLPGLVRTWTRQVHVHAGKRRRQTTGFQGPDSHGEKIWVFSHRTSQQIIYSFNQTLDGFHDLKQLPFNGKKSKPAKLRKDYWQHMAMIQFAPGEGAIGRTVFQKLRELKHLHEVSWPEELRYKQPEEFTSEDKKKVKAASDNGREHRPVRNKLERGRALNAQKPNAIADMAAVLSGQGPGNKMVVDLPGSEAQKLVDVTVSWSNDQDKEYAQEWTDNVTHQFLQDTTEFTPPATGFVDHSLEWGSGTEATVCPTAVT